MSYPDERVLLMDYLATTELGVCGRPTYTNGAPSFALRSRMLPQAPPFALGPVMARALMPVPGYPHRCLVVTPAGYYAYTPRYPPPGAQH
jgi:hypothetical protein